MSLAHRTAAIAEALAYKLPSNRNFAIATAGLWVFLYLVEYGPARLRVGILKSIHKADNSGPRIFRSIGNILAFLHSLEALFAVGVAVALRKTYGAEVLPVIEIAKWVAGILVFGVGNTGMLLNITSQLGAKYLKL
ncbi:hypothetical protein GQ42DRAFT_81618 [Ramicandelaber brevisporus]|nr:hypothetical protein GQ42DRAFT_81618 [Ramicandelaber brevisporus]